MRAELEQIPSGEDTAPGGAGPAVAFVTPHQATYLKPLYEAFAESQPPGWRTLLVWPERLQSEHPRNLVTPVASNLAVRRCAPRSAALARALDDPGLRLVVIHEFGPFSLRALRLARRRRIRTVLLTEVGRRNRRCFSWRARAWHRFWGRWVDGIAAACPAAHEPLSGRRLPTVSVYHAVDARIYRPEVQGRERSAPVTFAYAGQWIPRKGLDLWLDAARRLADEGADFRLRFIGAGDESWLRGRVAAAGLEARVEWSGFRSGEALRGELGSADVFVLPTRRDTYGAVVHEAACLGLPLLVSRHAGAAEALVRDDGNGFIIDPADTVSFAGRMALLLDPARRARMGQAARESGEQFSAHLRGAALWEWMAVRLALCPA